ncbi:Hsp20/alpha crystallin family protein [Halomonas maura]|uniref:Hsp20/alpha crystallin family protein n=1 Tax=Halomonas maura TaxID=117606 RepID=UPI0025B4B31A|nr:Hsp20/alpha crystallin family protein [Halomonas maura]MDN3558045.1 Hsp20/alpha crystallin family protein [Halomonas maura]
MDLQKFSPWNWFRSEGHDAPTAGEARGGEPAPLANMHQELDRWMDGMMRQFGMPSVATRFGEMPALLRPRLDIAERDHDYLITVEVPGVEKQDLTLSLDADRLIIEGEKRQETTRQEDRYQRVERSYGSFRRLLDLPADARLDGIEAAFDKGVLRITVPRSGEAKASRREIPING